MVIPESKSARSLSRRQFMIGAVGGFAALALAATGLSAVAGALEKVSAVDESTAWALLRGLNRTAFAAHLGETFQVRKDAMKLEELQLAQVADLAARSVSRAKANADVQKLECFSVVFSGSGLRPLKQGTYSIEHRDMGTFPLFIVPVGPAEHTLYYEAIFNRLQT